MSFENTSAASAYSLKSVPFENSQSPISLIEIHGRVRRLSQLSSKIESEKRSDPHHLVSTNSIIERGCETIRYIEQQISALLQSLNTINSQASDHAFTTRMVSHYISLYYHVLDNVLIGSWQRWFQTIIILKNPRLRVEQLLSTVDNSNSLRLHFLNTAIQAFAYAPIFKKFCIQLLFTEIRKISINDTQQRNPLDCPAALILGSFLQDYAHSEESLNSILNEITQEVLPSELIKQGLRSIAPYLEAKINKNSNTQLLLTPLETWSLAIKLGASCDLGDFEAVSLLVRYIKHRILPVYCDANLIDSSDNLLRIPAPNTHLLFHGLGGGAIESKIAVNPPVTDSILIFISAHRTIFSHSFFFSREIPESSDNALVAFIPCESLECHQTFDCQPNTSAMIPFLSQHVLHPKIVDSAHIWLPQSRHLFNPTVSNTVRQELNHRFSSNLQIVEDVTTYGSPAGLHDRVVVPDSVSPLEAIAYGWSGKAPELVYASQLANVSSKDSEARKVGKIRARRRFRLLAKRQLNKKFIIEEIIGNCDISQEIRSLVSHFLYRYTLRTLEEITKGKENLIQTSSNFTEKDFLSSVNCYVESSPPFNFDQNLRLFVLCRNFPEHQTSEKTQKILDVSTLLYKAPQRFTAYYAERSCLDPDLLSICKNVQFTSENESSLLQLWNAALEAEHHCIYPDQKNATNATIHKILRPLSEYLIHYGFSFEGGSLLSSKALGLVTSC